MFLCVCHTLHCKKALKDLEGLFFSRGKRACSCLHPSIAACWSGNIKYRMIFWVNLTFYWPTYEVAAGTLTNHLLLMTNYFETPSRRSCITDDLNCFVVFFPPKIFGHYTKLHLGYICIYTEMRQITGCSSSNKGSVVVSGMVINLLQIVNQLCISFSIKIGTAENVQEQLIQ